jgi:ABC-type molybdate transport system permease subunit
MARDIVELTLNQLLDVKAMFAALDNDILLRHMCEHGALLMAVGDAAQASQALPTPIIHEARRRAQGGEVYIYRFIYIYISIYLSVYT